MTQNQFSQETINQAIIAIKGHELDIQAMKEKCANMPLVEVAQTILIEKFGIAQIEAEEIVDDINKGIAEFDEQFKANVVGGRVTAKEKLSNLTKDLSAEERSNRYANILTALQLINKSEATQEEAEQLLDANSQKDIDTLAEEIEALLNDGINLDDLANAVKNGVNVEAVTEIAKHIEMNKDDYRFMTALWLYIAQREGSIKLSDSEVPVSAQMLGALSGASIEAILVTAELEDGKIDMKRWQVIMKWILGALFFAALLFLAWNVIGALAFISTYVVLELIGYSAISVGVALVVGFLLCWFVTDKTLKWGFRAMEFLGELYDEYINPFTEQVKAIAAKVKEWASKIGQVFTNRSSSGSGGSSNNAPVNQPVINNGDELMVQPVMA